MLLCIYVYYKCCVRNINYYCVFVFNFSVVLMRIINYYCFFYVSVVLLEIFYIIVRVVMYLCYLSNECILGVVTCRCIIYV